MPVSSGAGPPLFLVNLWSWSFYVETVKYHAWQYISILYLIKSEKKNPEVKVSIQVLYFRKSKTVQFGFYQSIKEEKCFSALCDFGLLTSP